jgi:hypothetical protein
VCTDPFGDAPGGDSWIVIICLPCVETSLVHQQSAIYRYTTPSRTSTIATRIPASKRTHKPIAAHDYSQHHRTLITRHSPQGLAPTIICDQTFSAGDDKQLSSPSTFAVSYQDEALLRTPRVRLLVGRGLHKQLAQVLPLERQGRACHRSGCSEPLA